MKKEKIRRTLVCSCGKEVKVSGYMGPDKYNCHVCRYPEVIKPVEIKKEKHNGDV